MVAVVQVIVLLLPTRGGPYRGPQFSADPAPPLSRQEQRALLYTAAGKSVPQIALLLDVRPTTIRTLQRRFTDKLNGRNQHHAASRAGLLGLYDLDRLEWAARQQTR